MVSFEVWLEGIATLIGTLIISIILGTYFLYKGRKLDAKLLFLYGFVVIFVGLLYLGPSVDFITILMTGKNMDNSRGLYGILSYIWVLPLNIVSFYVMFELIAPRVKKIVVSIYGVICSFLVLMIILFPFEVFEFTSPNGDHLIDASYKTGTITFLIVVFLIISSLSVAIIGYIIKAYQSTGIIRKKFIYLLIANLLFGFFGTLDTIVISPIAIIIVRLGMISTSYFSYLGLKPST